MNRTVVTLLRATLLLLAVCALGVQALIPFEARTMGTQFPEVSYLEVPYSIAAIAAILCFQVALFAVWRLLSMAASDQVFTDPACHLVNVVITCAIAATAICGAVWAHLLFVEQNGGPGVFAGVALCTIGGVAITLVLIVLRALLRTATADRHELIGVI